MKTVEEESPANAATMVADPIPPKRQSPQVQPPPPAKPAPPPPRPAPPVEKAPPEPVQPMTEVVKSAPAGKAGTNTCPQCGHQNDPVSAFCSNCGAILTVAQTIVMSSAVAPPKGRLHLVMEGGQAGEVYEIGDETLIGRTQGEITFPHDGFMSGRHARVERRGPNFVLVDEGSRNGTFIKLKGEIELKPGDMILVGKQLFRFERD
jgi:FHA domain/zinc-ribbon domain